MANAQGNKKTKRPTAIKRDIQNEKRRLINKSFKSKVRSAVRVFEDALSTKNNEKVTEALKEVYSVMDRGVKRGVFKLNKASRTKARATAKAAVVNS